MARVTPPVFSGEAVRAAVSPTQALDAVRDAFVAYARGEWTMPPKVYVPAYPAGDFRAMPALGGGHALLKWVTSFPGNPARGLPTVSGLVVLSSADYMKPAHRIYERLGFTRVPDRDWSPRPGVDLYAFALDL